MKFQSKYIITHVFSHQDIINNKNKFNTTDNSPMSLSIDAMIISGVYAMFACPFLYFIHLSITGHSSLLQNNNNKYIHVCTHMEVCSPTIVQILRRNYLKNGP